MAKIHPERQRVKIRDGKKVRTISFVEATVADLTAAIRGNSTEAGKTATKQPPAVKAIREALRGKKNLGQVGVTLRRDLVVLSIAKDKLAAVCAVLAKAKIPLD